MRPALRSEPSRTGSEAPASPPPYEPAVVDGHRDLADRDGAVPPPTARLPGGRHAVANHVSEVRVCDISERTTVFEPATLTLARRGTLPLETAGTAGAQIGDRVARWRRLERLRATALGEAVEEQASR